MTAINYYIYSNKKSTNFKYFNSKRNGIYYSDDMRDAIESDSTPNYTLNDVYNIEVDTDIYVSVKTEDIKTDASPSDKTTSLNWRITMNIRSYKNDSNYIQEFINKCMLKYEQYTTSKSKNKTYHFIYQGKSQGKLVFSSKIISDFSNPDNQNYETFDNTFHSNKDMLMADIKRLRDIDFYKRTGLKRKKGYLFYGKPGTGKTLSVMNMSNYDNRHIIEVPMSRIKTNNEIEAILTLTHINNIKLLYLQMNTSKNFNYRHWTMFIEFSPCGKYLAICLTNCSVKILDILSGQHIKEYIDDSHIKSISFSPCGKYLALEQSCYHIKLWNLNDNSIRKYRQDFFTSTILFTKWGNIISYSDKRIVIWNLYTNEIITTVNSKSRICACALSSCDRYLAYGTEDFYVILWDLNRQKIIKEYRHGYWVTSLSFSLDSKYLASSSSDKTVLIYTTPEFTKQQKITFLVGMSDKKKQYI
jgi:WD40 repeat protein